MMQTPAPPKTDDHLAYFVATPPKQPLTQTLTGVDLMYAYFGSDQQNART